VSEKTFLGDGLYAELDPARMIVLSAPRPGPDNAWNVHWVALEPEVLLALIKFCEKIGWGDIVRSGLTPHTMTNDERAVVEIANSIDPAGQP
jgi:hypothetical protein